MKIIYPENQKIEFNPRVTTSIILSSAGLLNRGTIPEEIKRAAERANQTIDAITLGDELHETAYYDIVARALDIEASQYSTNFRLLAKINGKERIKN